MKNIQFIDLQAQRAYLGSRIDDAIARVLEHGRFIMGPEIGTFEAQLAEFGEAAHAVSCSSGTDSILLPLMAWDIGPGDAVFAPSFTFAATAEVIALLGATPVFVDVLPGSFNIDPEHLKASIKAIKDEGTLTPRAVIAVDLFGQIADYPALKEITDAEGLKLVADAAQGYGSTLNGKQACAWADAVTTSFFPAKPLGCYGDGGATLTNDAELANILQSLRVHGKGTDKYDNIRIGLNARLDTLQAGILIEKLAIFADEIATRNKVADRYNSELASHVQTPFVIDGGISTWAQYTVVTDRREKIMAGLKDANVPAVVYYAKPLHQQTIYAKYPTGPGGLPVTNRLADQVFSLPMHPYLRDADIERICNALCSCA